MLWKISTDTTKIAFSTGGVVAYKAAAEPPDSVANAAGINGSGYVRSAAAVAAVNV
jgi:hypothetical protein